jgi:hypothetical protein
MVCGLMTTMGGVGHTLPFLITNFHVAMLVAVVVVALELAATSWIRHKYMETPLLAAAFQVVVGIMLFPEQHTGRLLDFECSGSLKHKKSSKEWTKRKNDRNRHQRCRLQVVAGVGDPGCRKRLPNS